jgi:hypothetical protein
MACHQQLLLQKQLLLVGPRVRMCGLQARCMTTMQQQRIPLRASL